MNVERVFGMLGFECLDRRWSRLEELCHSSKLGIAV